MQALIDKGADVNAKGNDGTTALMNAANNERDNSLDTVLTLIDKGADVNAKRNDGFTALMFASAKGNLDAVQALIDKGADLNAKTKKGATALKLATNPAIIALLKKVKTKRS